MAIVFLAISHTARYYAKFTFFMLGSTICAGNFQIMSIIGNRSRILSSNVYHSITSSIRITEISGQRLSDCVVSFQLHITFHTINTISFHWIRLPAWGCKLILASMGLTFEVRGHDNIDRNKGGVVLINHQSGIDLVGTKKKDRYCCYSLSKYQQYLQF